MKHRLFFVLAALGLLCACRDAVRTEGTAQEGVSLDSLWKRCVDLRVGAEGSRVDVSDCVRGVPMPILVDSTPFAAADYSFVRVNAVTGYELCRYGEHALLEIEQGGCEYFGVTFRWSYNAVGEVVSDRQLVRRALLDTRQERDLAGTLTADIVLQLLSYVAETERVFIRQRQAEGIAAARARGQTFGRPRLEVPPAFAEVYRRWNSGEMSSRAAAERLGISQPTFLRWVRETP